jgi:hypothetical protein
MIEPRYCLVNAAFARMSPGTGQPWVIGESHQKTDCGSQEGTRMSANLKLTHVIEFVADMDRAVKF